MAEQARKGKDMKLRIVGCRQVYAGINPRGDHYTIFEIDAAKPDGSLVEEKLRAFTALPIGQDAEVTVVPFDSDKWGRSYTLYPKGSRGAGATAQHNELREMVEELQKRVASLSERVAALEQQHTRKNGASPPPPASPNNTALDQQFGAEAPW